MMAAANVPRRTTATGPAVTGVARAARVALGHVVRLALDGDWNLSDAAARLRRVAPDERTLRLVRARVWRGVAGHPTPTATRILSTIDAALLDGPADLGTRHVPNRSPRTGAMPGPVVIH